MTSTLRSLIGKVVRLRRDENGTASLEFVILFPLFMSIVFASFETGYMMVRNVMLERGVDHAVRELRLGMPPAPDGLSEVDAAKFQFDALKQTICDRAVIFKDCNTVIQLQLQPVDMVSWGPLTDQPLCIDVEQTIDPYDATSFVTGGNNELMLVRVCALLNPMFPTTGLGLRMQYNARGDYALVATSAFVNEPGR